MKIKIIVLLAMIIIALIASSGYLFTGLQYTKLQLANKDLVIGQKQAQIEETEKLSAEKVELLKEELINDLAVKCETKGAKEPDGAIILDSNNQMSIGSWMWQIKSVQHYVKQFEDRDITKVEAIRIAIDHDQAKALTKKVVFEVKDGIENWSNCATKLPLRPKIELLTRL
jgi:hypothetical protein